MRFREFKPSLYEFVLPTSQHQSSVDILARILKNEDPSSETFQSALEIVKKLKLKMDQTPQEPKSVPGQISENMMNDDELVNWYMSSIKDANTKAEIEKMLSSNRAFVMSLAKHQQDRDTEQEVSVRNKVEQERGAAEKVVSDLVTKIVNSRFSVGKDVTIKAIIGVIEGIIRSKEYEFEDLQEFLIACDNNGLINTTSMINPNGGEGSITLVNEKYKSLIQNFLSIAEVKVGNATWGRGEIGLAFCGIDTRKEASDISIGKTHIEVKAGSQKIDFFLKGTKGFKTQMPALEELISALNNVASKNELPTFNANNKTKMGGISKLGYRKVVGTKTETGLNAYFMHMGKEAVENLLIKILLQIHKKSPEIVKKYEDDIKASVNPSGAIYYKKLAVTTSMISFEYYQAMENHDGILFLNIPNFTYNYQPAGNVQNFGKLVADNKIKPTAVIDFRDNSDGGISYFIP
jgi:hypothetical protein